MPQTFLELFLTVLGSIAASSGFWFWIQKRGESKDLGRRLLLGLAHDRIVHLGMTYISRGYITKDEYESLYDFLYKPYEEMGGNGSAKRVMCEVEKLPIREGTHFQVECLPNDAK